jgi:hypothetical protein
MISGYSDILRLIVIIRITNSKLWLFLTKLLSLIVLYNYLKFEFYKKQASRKEKKQSGY